MRDHFSSWQTSFVFEPGLGPELLSTADMYAADAAATAYGATPDLLMEAAGRSVADLVDDAYTTGSVSILCGPGNNGGDGYVIGRWLRQKGWTVHIGQFGPAPSRDEAGRAVQRWDGPVTTPQQALAASRGIIVDALFGAGLSRPLDGEAASIVAAANCSGRDILAVDMPSGVDGDSGAIQGTAIQATRTATFFRAKPGHCLLPGRANCGAITVHDIGIPTRVLDGKVFPTGINLPQSWAQEFPGLSASDHKYKRGATAIVGGRDMTGAARLAGGAARRVGAGLVTLLVPPEQVPIYAVDQPGAIVAATGAGDLARSLASNRQSAVLVGPGLGVTETTRDQVLVSLEQPCPVVVDADGLSAFAQEPGTLLAALRRHGNAVITPHEGEFARVFSLSGTKVERAAQAARYSHCIVIFKGYDTVIAAPDGRCQINVNAPATLATAGSGDVLAGIVTGLLAQGMPVFSAACAAVWMHGEAASRFGLGLLAEDLAAQLPSVLEQLASLRGQTPGWTDRLGPGAKPG